MYNRISSHEKVIIIIIFISFSYNGDTGECQLALVDFLENPEGDNKAKVFYIDVDAIPNIPMYCRGGYGCCHKDYTNRCGDGDGDCNVDEDCVGSLICGSNNCKNWRSLTGMWDSDDDCCERRCTKEHPCKEGDGHCEDDNDCQNPGWLKCGDNLCLDQTYFPRNIFTNNSETYMYSTSDNCCYRPCSSRYNLCSEGEIGCLFDNDCEAGHYCKKDVPQPFCTEIDECIAGNGKYEGLTYCGSNTECINTVGSFTCTCKPGFHDFQPLDGCIDIDECATGDTNCGENTDCWNTVGSFLCGCKIGFTGDQTKGCSDIDECSDPDWNSCKKEYSFELSDKSNLNCDSKLEERNLNDGAFHKFRFSVISTNVIIVSIGPSNKNSYRFWLSQDNLSVDSCAEDECQRIFNKDLPDEGKLQREHFTSYFTTFQLKNGNMEITFGINEEKVIFDQIQDPNPGIKKIKIMCGRHGNANSNINQNSYLRNVGQGSASCKNTIGSYVCWEDSLEKVAIIYGGHTRSVSVYPSEFTMIRKDKVICSSHTIDPVSGRYAPGMHSGCR